MFAAIPPHQFYAIFYLLSADTNTMPGRLATRPSPSAAGGGLARSFQRREIVSTNLVQAVLQTRMEKVLPVLKSQLLQNFE
jgi:hypothetical protein